VAGSEGRGAICVKVFGFRDEIEREGVYFGESFHVSYMDREQCYLLLSETVPSLFFHYLSVYLPFSVSVIRVCICIFICILFLCQHFYALGV